jgi:hypothetical protein
MRPIRALAAVATALLAVAPAAATTYKMAPDEALADRADRVVEARVVATSPGTRPGPPSTDYRIEVERAVAGKAAGGTLVVNVPGGERADGIGLQLYGVPAFEVGERALLFLRDNGDGTHRILHLGLGAFRIERAGERLIAARDLSGADVVGADAAPAGAERDLERFTAWLADRERGERRSADYWVAGGLRPATAEATFITRNGRRMRWFEFDAGQSVVWRAHNGGQSGLAGAGYADFQAGIGAWVADSASNVGYTYAGQTSATGGHSVPDGVNAIQFGVALSSDFDCDSGGVLAVGGPWYDQSDTGVYNGETYIRIREADILVNDGLECFFASSPSPNLAAAELFGHELGHTLGIGHSCGDGNSGSCGLPGSIKEDALMKASVHDDSRGARLNDDDRSAVRTLYTRIGGGGGSGAPRSPASLVIANVTASSLELRWDDRSNNETTFHLERKVGGYGATFSEIGTVAANVESFVLTGLSPATRYTFRVRARNASGYSGYSNERTVTTATGIPAAPGSLRAEPGTCDICSPPLPQLKLTWADLSTNETAFQVHVKTPATGAFTLLATLPANTTSYSLDNPPVGLPHTFRVRALNGAAGSAFSNDASATSPQGVTPSACTADVSTLCLGTGGRFRVRSVWRTTAGSTGSGGAIPDTNSTTGFFWFFDAANVELAVKVLDGTAINDFYWTFFGALSDVDYWLIVEDTVTGESRTYHNPQGSVVGQADTTSLPEVESHEPLPVVATPACFTPLPPEDTTTAPSTCVAGPNQLCLLGGRFAVTVSFSSGVASGAAHAVPFAGSEQSGRFWFFDAANTELLVKVLDGRPLNGKFWVFYGALSNVGYQLRVEDTVTGKVRTYTNAAGNFCGRADTAAF